MSLELRLSGIAKGYGGAPVLRDCSFSFDGGGPYILMGANGSGKSTLLRICALIEEPDSGEVAYRSDRGILARDLSLRRRITLVLPRIGVFNASVFGNVAYGLRVRGLDGKESAEKVWKALEFVGLQDKARRGALTLSSGETQKLGMARAIVIEPEILFLDEPTAFIDEASKAVIEEIILRVRHDSRSMVIMATHDREQAERLGGRILRLVDGRLVV